MSKRENVPLLDPDRDYHVPEPKTHVEELLRKLSWLAYEWFKTKNDDYVRQYHEIYAYLRSLGWNGSIDIEAELPDELMPPGYFSD